MKSCIQKIKPGDRILVHLDNRGNYQSHLSGVKPNADMTVLKRTNSLVVNCDILVLGTKDPLAPVMGNVFYNQIFPEWRIETLSLHPAHHDLIFRIIKAK